MDTWISVDERLPNANGEYLVYRNNSLLQGVIEIASFSTNLRDLDDTDFGVFDKPGWYRYNFEWGFIEVPQVKYWMPLPEAPAAIE